MAIVRLGPEGEVEVIAPATPEEKAAAEAGLHRLIAALVALGLKEDRTATGGDQADDAAPPLTVRIERPPEDRL